MEITFKKDLTLKSALTPESLVDLLLENRGVKDKESFLHPATPLGTSVGDFGYKTQLKKALKILKKIYDSGEMIVVYTDYDADGITGGAILWETLHLLGFKAMPYVPHRSKEGYGFSKFGIDAIIEKYNPALIISVDHGITAIEEIRYAKSKGVSVIVTDHHHKQKKVPDQAEAIFHIPELSGSGVAYVFASDIATYFQKDSKFRKLLKRNFEIDYLALAAIGSVADLVPLVGKTRAIVYHGLKVFGQVKRPGIMEICREAKIEGHVITPYEIGYIIAPRINAVGRLEHAINALRLLCTTDVRRARELASSVGEKNSVRQNMVSKSVEEAISQVEKLKLKGDLPPIIILENAAWHEGVIGLIASKILEIYYRPTIILTMSDGQMKASARSIPALHITHLFESLSKYLIRFGGHAGAAGFTMLKNNYEEFKEKAIKKVGQLLTEKDLIRKLEVDAKVPVGTMSMQLVKQISTLSPFGMGNPNPSFVSVIEIFQASIFGKSASHIKLFAKDPGGSNLSLEMIGFGKSEIFSKISKGAAAEIAYNIEINEWNGRSTLRAKIIAINLQ